jgi:hypothetical protein
MTVIARWRWRRRRNQAFGFWENREGERVGPIPLDEQGRPAFVPATDCQGGDERVPDGTYGGAR